LVMTILVMMVGLSGVSSYAGGKSFSNYGLADWLEFSGGLLTEIGLHEGGHYIGAKVIGENIKFSGLDWEFEGNPASGKKNAIYLSGFALPMIVAEVALDYPDIPKDDPFVKGIIYGPLLHNIVYIIKDVVNKGGNRNDFEGMERNGLSREVTYPLTLLVPLFQVWRLSGQTEEVYDNSFTSRITPNLYPTHGGLGIYFSFRF